MPYTSSKLYGGDKFKIRKRGKFHLDFGIKILVIPAYLCIMELIKCENMNKFNLIKKCIALFLLVLPLAACGNNNRHAGNLPATLTDTISGKSILIVYFSKAGENYAVGHVDVGNTAVMASYIKDYTGGDIFEIIPEDPYPDNYDATEKRAEREKAENARPGIKNKLPNLDKYDIIFIGSPVWVYDAPMIMYTFCETYKNELAHKTIVPFATHEGSGISDIERLLKKYMPDAGYLRSFDVRGREIRSSQEKVNEWLKSLKMPKNK